MATRWTSKHTGQKIDDTIDYVCNPNLLDNWYFGNPVNQRGQTSYSANSYTIDRWRTDHNVSYGTLTVDKTTGCVTLSHADDGGFVNFVQYLENPPTEIITLSVLMLSGNLYSATGTLGNISLNADEIYIRSGELNSVVFRCKTGKTISIIAAKLELGSQQTLAHQDADGNWVLNEIPNYGEQLARCQRYAIDLNPNRQNVPIIGTVKTDGTTMWLSMPIPTSLRTTPVITNSRGTVVVSNDSGSSEIAFGNDVRVSSGMITIAMTGSTKRDGFAYMTDSGGVGIPTALLSADL